MDTTCPQYRHRPSLVDGFPDMIMNPAGLYKPSVATVRRALWELVRQQCTPEILLTDSPSAQ